jgi:hypothetical protein
MKGRFHEMLIIADTCKAASMFNDVRFHARRVWNGAATSKPAAAASLGLEGSAGWATPSARGLWRGRSSAALRPKPRNPSRRDESNHALNSV